MPIVNLNSLVQALDKELKTDLIKDYPGALNGLQVANKGRVTKVAAAVDANESVIQMAIKAGADLLIVHHGLFWGGKQPITGVLYRKIALCIEHNLAIYSSHLPLDAHPTLGNNILLARALGFKKTQPAFEAFGTPIGRQVKTKISRDLLVERLTNVVHGRVHLVAGGRHHVENVGIVTGAGDVNQAIKEGVDTFITGEIPHHAFGLALEYGINLMAAGHYATETFGVKALAKWMEKKFHLPWEFIDLPSGI